MSPVSTPGPQANIIWDIVEERRRQDEKWGVQNHGDAYWLAILGEEFGEICRDILERGEASAEELVQLVAVGVAWLECKSRKSSTPKVDTGQTTIEEQITAGRAAEGIKLCWQGPCYAHGAHEWFEDKPGGKTYRCPGASTDRT